MLSSSFIATLLLPVLGAAIPSRVNQFQQPQPGLISRSSNSSSNSTDSVCSGNTASDRSVWCDYSIDTNYYNEGPDTGVVVEYWFELTNITVSPDGISRIAQTVNGSIPGPTIEASWGDTVRVHVINGLDANGTSIHFHGVRQNWTNSNDGVISITQCPTAPGNTVTYEWKATQYGSSWYHSHYALQAWEGVFGGILIHGPATANYDEDLGNLFLNDWDHKTADAWYSYAQTVGPPTLGTGLINGSNTWDNGTVGTRWSTDFTAGTSYLLRVVNGAIDTHFQFSIDGHTLQVIAMDFVPIEPYTTEVLSIGMGQRYDIIVQADQGSGDFWLRAWPDTYCSNNDNGDQIMGIIHYDGSTGTPDSTAHTNATTTTSCAGEPYDSLVPYLPLSCSAYDSTHTEDGEVTVSTNSDSLFKWYIGSTTFLVEWSDPTALQIVNGDSGWSSSEAVIELTEEDQWFTLIIETTLNVPHPIHLHGHDFFVLAQGTGTYAAVQPTLNTDNPPRRDVAMLPTSGYLVIAFQADNPGAWLAHCHIGWHTEEGFALQFVERASEIPSLYNKTELTETCDAWSTWQSDFGLLQEDSGV